MMVELKNGETLNGFLIVCDTWMNLTLREVTQTSAEGDRFVQLSEVYVRGNNVSLLSDAVGMRGGGDLKCEIGRWQAERTGSRTEMEGGERREMKRTEMKRTETQRTEKEGAQQEAPPPRPRVQEGQHENET